MSCPICGHSDLTFTEEERPFKSLYGPPIMATIRTDHCSNCGEDGDFDMLNDRHITVAIDLSAVKSVPIMAEKLQNEHNCSRPYIERVTHLPFGSIEKCEGGEYDRAVITTLEMACTFPPILLMLDNARTGA